MITSLVLCFCSSSPVAGLAALVVDVWTACRRPQSNFLQCTSTVTSCRNTCPIHFPFLSKPHCFDLTSCISYPTNQWSTWFFLPYMITSLVLCFCSSSQALALVVNTAVHPYVPRPHQGTRHHCHHIHSVTSFPSGTSLRCQHISNNVHHKSHQMGMLKGGFAEGCLIWAVEPFQIFLAF